MPAEGTPDLVLHELRDMRRKQDGQLDGLRRLATGALIIELTAGTIAAAVNTVLAPHTAVIVFGAAILLGANLVAIEIAASRWREGPNIDRLIRYFRQERPSLQRMQLALMKSTRSDYNRNERTLARIRYLVFVQAVLAFAPVAILLYGLRELT